MSGRFQQPLYAPVAGGSVGASESNDAARPVSAPPTSDQSQAEASFEAFLQAVADEHRRFNQAVAAGAVVVLVTDSDMYRVLGVSAGWWYNITPTGDAGIRPEAPSRPVTLRLKGANNRVWSDFLRQARVARHPRLQEPTRQPGRAARRNRRLHRGRRPVSKPALPRRGT